MNHMEDGISNNGGMHRVAHLCVWNKYAINFRPNTGYASSDVMYTNADTDDWEEVDTTSLPDFDYIIVEATGALPHDENGRDIFPIVLIGYGASKLTEDSDEPLSFYIDVYPMISEAKNCPICCWQIATISLYKA